VMNNRGDHNTRTIHLSHQARAQSYMMLGSSQVSVRVVETPGMDRPLFFIRKFKS